MSISEHVTGLVIEERRTKDNNLVAFVFQLGPCSFRLRNGSIY